MRSATQPAARARCVTRRGARGLAGRTRRARCCTSRRRLATPLASRGSGRPNASRERHPNARQPTERERGVRCRQDSSGQSGEQSRGGAASRPSRGRSDARHRLLTWRERSRVSVNSAAAPATSVSLRESRDSARSTRTVHALVRAKVNTRYNTSPVVQSRPPTRARSIRPFTTRMSETRKRRSHSGLCTCTSCASSSARCPAPSLECCSN